jgi:hypothetical protein
MSYKVDAEQFYIPWLYDLAVLEKHLSGPSFRLSYSVTIPYADRSDKYVDSIPSPDLVFFLTYTHSYLEKGLKYLCLISDQQTSYSQVAGYRHDLQKTWQQLQRVPAGASLEKILRDSTLWDLFNALLTLNHPGLRYLHVEKRVTVDIGRLPNLVNTFKEFLLLLRRDVVFSDPVVFPQLKALRTIVRASVPVVQSAAGLTVRRLGGVDA